MRKLRVVLRLTVVMALAAVVRGEASQVQAGGFCGYCDYGDTQCPGLGHFIDKCDMWCGAGSYATGCVDYGCGKFPPFGMWVQCGLIS